MANCKYCVHTGNCLKSNPTFEYCNCDNFRTMCITCSNAAPESYSVFTPVRDGKKIIQKEEIKTRRRCKISNEIVEPNDFCSHGNYIGR